jgi:hypothetical protein
MAAMSGRGAAAALSVLGVLTMAACGGGGTPSGSGAGPATASPTATPLTTATPGPSAIQGTLTGDTGISGPLTAGATQFVRCEEPTLAGEVIYAYESTADPKVGIFLTIGDGSIDVRLGSGSGTAYAERDFHGSGVTSFGAASGSQFSSSLTETTAAGGAKGSVETVSSISGSVSCGTFSPGSGTVSVDGQTPDGAITGELTSLRVTCLPGQQAGVVSGLTHVGSTPALVDLAGGSGGNPFFVSVATAKSSRQYTEPPPAVAFTFSGSTITYHATATLTTGTATSSVMVSGTATCGS